MKIRIGTRGSQLALYQANLVETHLKELLPQAEIEIRVIKTSGDVISHQNSLPLETKRVFTKEIEEALSAGEIDLAVHSAKDLSVHMPEGLAIGAVFKREDSRDAFISKNSNKLSELPKGSVIGTSSLRRKMLLLKKYPHLKVEELRGNVDTRLKKLSDGKYDGILLAAAGLIRLGLQGYITEYLDIDDFLPAAGQGIIVAQLREDREDLKELMGSMTHEESRVMLEIERGYSRELGGNCQLPCGISVVINGPKIDLSGILLHPDKPTWVEKSIKGQMDSFFELGEQLASEIIHDGGREILSDISEKK